MLAMYFWDNCSTKMYASLARTDSTLKYFGGITKKIVLTPLKKWMEVIDAHQVHQEVLIWNIKLKLTNTVLKRSLTCVISWWFIWGNVISKHAITTKTKDREIRPLFELHYNEISEKMYILIVIFLKNVWLKNRARKMHIEIHEA